MALIFFYFDYDDDCSTCSRRNRDGLNIFWLIQMLDGMNKHTDKCLLCTPRWVWGRAKACWQWFWELAHVCVRWDTVSTVLLVVPLPILLLYKTLTLDQPTTGSHFLAAFIALQCTSLFWFSGCSRCVAEALVVRCCRLSQTGRKFYSTQKHNCEIWCAGFYLFTWLLEALIATYVLHHGRSTPISQLSLIPTITQGLHMFAEAFTNGCPLCWRTRGFRFERLFARWSRNRDAWEERNRTKGRQTHINAAAEALGQGILGGAAGGIHVVVPGSCVLSTDGKEEQARGAVIVHEAEMDWEVVPGLPVHHETATKEKCD
ncbi:hypothetical protein B0A48_11758 [Cryoendolithus antarcticus]|uniref:Uncharacterized protein n=1 Tax=Cryoendolithus antarcticus TaxID=1507870 RepID=A0A1V8ST58_9PEZI|nr:hypothetical protein B0A48_11758 [Cryoendolithus antarcticus]